MHDEERTKGEWQKVTVTKLIINNNKEYKTGVEESGNHRYLPPDPLYKNLNLLHAENL